MPKYDAHCKIKSGISSRSVNYSGIAAKDEFEVREKVVKKLEQSYGKNGLKIESISIKQR